MPNSHNNVVIGEILFKGELGNVEPNVLNSNTLSKLIKLITLMYNYNVECVNCFAYKLECHNPSNYIVILPMNKRH
jgi:hypothetical protein